MGQENKRQKRSPEVAPELMTAQQAADFCGMGRSTLFKLISEELFPDGRQMPWGKRWHRDVLRQWLDAQWQAAEAPKGGKSSRAA